MSRPFFLCSGCFSLWPVSTNEVLTEPSRMWLWQQPQASPSSCQQAPETERKKESRPAPNFTSLPALTAGTKGGWALTQNMEKPRAIPQHLSLKLVFKIWTCMTQIYSNIVLFCCLFTNGFNSRRSIEAFVSLLCVFPSVLLFLLFSPIVPPDWNGVLY